ncbi:LysR family transcriptional regulator [Vibrio ulleungensis]|uniref:LysR family transcriptional regulator n=1 Tax=Vibrio ulleungensis TaxID=2807619 RepID=A0ABS2HKQ3_9VIBR|nr:LysR family transcriptional regulator [Vibrio ulleungensis]MBM7036773.1 LysR family transcriptional regulator [Vibrio ulleungensis]
MLQLDQIEAYLAVYELGSIAKAAKKLNLRHAEASLLIENLEIALDTKLFERSKNSITPTQAGILLFPHAQQFAHQGERILHLSASSNLSSGSLRIGLDHMVPIEEIEGAIAKVSSKYQLLEINVTRGLSQDLIQQLETDELDVIVHVFFTDAPSQTERTLLRYLVWVACCSPDSEFADLDLISNDQLAKRRQICCASMFNNPLTKIGGKAAFETWQCTDQEDVARLIEEDLGWGYLPQALYREREALGLLTKFNTESNAGDVNITTRLELLHSSSRTLSEPQQMFLDLLIDQK